MPVFVNNDCRRQKEPPHWGARLLAAAGCLLLFSGINVDAVATDLVVDNVRGSDVQNDRGQAPAAPSFGPYRTINRALAVAQSGDRIILTKTPIPYRECISLTGINNSGSPQAPFRILGNGATVDGSEAPRPDGWDAVPDVGDVWRYRQSPPGFGLLLSSTGGWRSLTPRDNGLLPLTQLEPRSWTRQAASIYLRTEPGKGPRDYPLQMTMLTTGITLYDVQHVVIEDLVVRGFRLDGVNAHERVTDTVLQNVTAEFNGRSGISVGGASEVLLRQSQVQANGTAQLRTEGRGVIRLQQVTVDENSAPAISHDGGSVRGQWQPLASDSESR